MKVSVVVPTYNRPGLLNRCLAALVGQDFDHSEYEIIVADDAASRLVRLLVEWWATAPTLGETLPAIRYVPVRHTHGPAAARNAGWRMSRGEVIAFTDDDCIPSSDWLRQGLKSFEDGIAAAYGKILMPIPRKPTDYELDASHLEHAEFVTANCFFRRQALAEVGGFDERFTLAWREDSDLFFSVLERDGRVVMAEKAVVIHPVRPAPWGVSISQQRKAMFNALLYKKHPGLYRRYIQSKPPLNYYAIVMFLIVMLLSSLASLENLRLLALFGWFLSTMFFCLKRLKETSHAFRHIIEMIFTSIVIPPLALYWRLRGAWKYRVLFF